MEIIRAVGDDGSDVPTKLWSSLQHASAAKALSWTPMLYGQFATLSHAQRARRLGNKRLSAAQRGAMRERRPPTARELQALASLGSAYDARTDTAVSKCWKRAPRIMNQVRFSARPPACTRTQDAYGSTRPRQLVPSGSQALFLSMRSLPCAFGASALGSGMAGCALASKGFTADEGE